MPRSLHIACLQTRPLPDFQSALAEALELANEAVGNGATFLSLPEYCGGLRTEGSLFAPPAAEEADHPVLNGLRAFAAENSVWIQIGSVAVPGVDGKITNRGFFVNDRGEIVSRYDKIHMFDIQLSEAEVYRESAVVDGGDAACVVETPMGRFGHTICYDLRFPALYRCLAQAGAEVLTCPAAFTKKTGEAHWHILNRARAIENGAYVVSACATGPVDGGGEAYGHSLIVDPWGEVVADGGEGPGIASAVIDLDKVAEARGKIPSLSHDRRFSNPVVSSASAVSPASVVSKEDVA